MKGRHPFPPVFFATIRQLLPKRSAPPFLMHDSSFLRSFIVYLLKCPTRSSFFDQRKLYAGAVTKSLPPFTSAFLIVSKKASSSSMCSRTSKMPAAGSEFFLKPPSSRVEHITFLRPRFIAFDAPCRPGSTRQTS